MDGAFTRDPAMKEFTRIASEYDKGRSSENVDFWTGETKRLAGLKQGTILLDLGCGTGIYTLGMGSKTGATMCGLDPSTAMLYQAREKTSEVHWFSATGESLPVREEVFDCVFSSQVWHHIEDKQGTANECGRVLKQGGTVVIRTISHDQLRRKVVFEYFPEIMENQLKVYPSEEEFNRYFSEAGFASTEHLGYEMERYQTVDEFIEIAEKKLWSMFRSITNEGLERGIEKLRQHARDQPGQPVRNNETITLVVSRKRT